MDLPKYIPGEYLEGYVKLASNENNWGPSPKVVETLKENADKVFLYPYKAQFVNEKLAEYVGVDKENILCGNGSDELLDLILKAFKGPVVASTPSFAYYPIAAKGFGEKFIEIQLEADFTFNAEKFIEGAQDARIAFLCSPNNPTGMGISDMDVAKVLGTDMLVVVDEAYAEFAKADRTKLIKDYDNLIVLRTLSKSFALAGLRIGYAVAQPELINALSKVRPPFSNNILSETAALTALDDIPYMRDCVSKIIRGRKMISDALSKKFRVYPSESNFVFADVSPYTAEEFYQKIFNEKIIVRKFNTIKGYPGEYIRVNAGTEMENKLFIDAVEKLF